MKKMILFFGAMAFSIPQAYAVHQLIFRDASALTTGTVSNSLLDNSSITKLGPLIEVIKINGNPTSVPFYNNGAFIGSVNTINVNGNAASAAVIGTTATITASANGFAPRTYDLYVGTPGTPGIDVTVGGSASWQSLFSSISAQGMTYASSGTKRVFVSNGVYEISNTTIPAGVYIFCGSSVTFTPTNTIDPIFTIYGRIYNPRFDVQDRTFGGELVRLKGNAWVENILSVSNSASMDTAAGARMMMFSIKDSTFCRLTGQVDNFVGAQQDVAAGGLFTLIRSSDCYINLNTLGAVLTTQGKQSVFVSQGDRNVIEGNYDKIGSRFLAVDGGNIGLKLNGRFHITQAWGSTGFIYMRSINFAIKTTTGIVISSVFQADVIANQPIIQIQGDQGGFGGVLVTNCFAFSSQIPANSPSALVKVSDIGVTATIVADNHVFGMPLVLDSGTQTTYTSLANTNDIVKP